MSDAPGTATLEELQLSSTIAPDFGSSAESGAQAGATSVHADSGVTFGDKIVGGGADNSAAASIARQVFTGVAVAIIVNFIWKKIK